MTEAGERGTERPDDAPATFGLRALYAALDATATRYRLDALGIAVDDPDLGRQLFATGRDAATVVGVLAADTARWWCAEPVINEAPPELSVLRMLGAAAVRLAVVGGDPDRLATLEVRLRGLAEVDHVVRAGACLQVVARPGRRADLVRRLATIDPADGPIVVIDEALAQEPASATPPKGRNLVGERAELVAVRTSPETGELEVHLRLADRRTVGRAPIARAAAGAAAATLEALAGLGPTDAELQELRVGWVRTIDTTPDREFLVVVSIRRPDARTCYGIAPGTSPIEAAARATLHACNRVHTSLRARRET